MPLITKKPLSPKIPKEPKMLSEVYISYTQSKYIAPDKLKGEPEEIISGGW